MSATKGRFQVLFGTVGTITEAGSAAYHALGDLVDLTEAEAERLLGLGAVVDTKVDVAVKETPPPEPKA